jgi:RNA polymerase sigma-70 factor (ECF subfamily)
MRLLLSGGDIAAELHAARRYALLLTRNADQAEDLVQEALARAIAGARTWRPGADLRRWLLAIVHNVHASRQRRLRLELAAAREASDTLSVATPEPQGDRVHLTETIAALMALPAEQREPLVLVAFEGLSYRDAAEILGLPVGTLMSRLARGREALRAATGRTRPAEPGETSPAARRRNLRVVE